MQTIRTRSDYHEEGQAKLREGRICFFEQWLKDVGYNENENEDENTMNLTVNNHSLKVNLAENATTEALLARLQNGSVTYNAHDYGGFEKVGALGFSLPCPVRLLNNARRLNYTTSMFAGLNSFP